MLLSNQTHIQIRLLGGALGGATVGRKSFVANAASFGGTTSIPQGYNDPSKALTPTVRTGGNISARMAGTATLTADLGGIGNMQATLAAEADMIAENNALLNGSATFAAEADMVAAIAGQGNISANFDILARPSANDIAQEVWNARSAAFVSAGTLGRKLSDAESAAKLAAALSA